MVFLQNMRLPATFFPAPQSQAPHVQSGGGDPVIPMHREQATGAQMASRRWSSNEQCYPHWLYVSDISGWRKIIEVPPLAGLPATVGTSIGMGHVLQARFYRVSYPGATDCPLTCYLQLFWDIPAYGPYPRSVVRDGSDSHLPKCLCSPTVVTPTALSNNVGSDMMWQTEFVARKRHVPKLCLSRQPGNRPFIFAVVSGFSTGIM